MSVYAFLYVTERNLTMSNSIYIEFKFDAKTQLDSCNFQQEAELFKNHINKYLQERFKVDHLEDQRATLRIDIDEERYIKNYTELDLIVK